MNPNMVPTGKDMESRRVDTAKTSKGSRQPANAGSTGTAINTKSSSKDTSSRFSNVRKKTRNLPPVAPHPFPAMDDRLPINSPAVALGIAVQSVRRELEQEKERKRVAPGPGVDAINSAGGNESPSGINKPKMKKIVVRKR
jgi:signal recognition particle subunit SRP19